ncbi:MAG: ftsY, partial [Ornithinibacter sp.]|nr:ftsY [Ornithinibacter sp.]
MSSIDTLWEYLAVAVGILVVVGGIAVGLMRGRGGRRSDLPATRPGTSPGGRAVDVDQPPGGSVGTVEHPVEVGPEAAVEEGVSAPTLERPEAPAGRLRRLRARLARSNTALGKGLLALLAGGRLDEAAWEEVEDTLLTADLGVAATTELVAALRTRVAVEGATDEASVRGWLREELLALVDPSLDRSVVASRVDGRPACVLVVGVNGTGKTTTVGKLARVLVAEDKDVVLGAADT